MSNLLNKIYHGGCMTESLSMLQDKLLSLMQDNQYKLDFIRETSYYCKKLEVLQNELKIKSEIPLILDKLEQFICRQYHESKVYKTDYLLLNRIIYRYRQIISGKNPFSFKPFSNCVSNDYYNSILRLIEDSIYWNNATKQQLYYSGRNLFNWLILKGYNSFDGVDKNVMYQYYSERAKKSIGAGLNNFRYFTKTILIFFYERKIITQKIFEIFLLPVPSPLKLLPAISVDEMTAILDAVRACKDRTAERDYAILLLACVTGLRACDIIRLSLHDIDWRNGELKITQQKTGKVIYIPLTTDIGNAMKNYIINSRPQCKSHIVFLRFKAPFTGISRQEISVIYKKFQKIAGIVKKPYDGKSFHSIRRAFGVRLLSSGAEINLVAQTLGHENLQTIDRYISLDKKNLINCSLDFSGIEPIRRGDKQ